MTNQHKEKLKEAQYVVDELKDKVKQHHWYPHYHVAPPAQWMNDPNGFSFFKGEAHLFYQHHPFSVKWGPMYWGHVKSEDLVFWEHLPIALAPSEEYDRDGCFSGSAIEKDGKLYLMYTGHVFTGPDHDEDLIQTQALAVSEDGIYFEKLPQNPVISEAPEGDIHQAHFRDPKVWLHNGIYYAVIGSKTKKNTGQVLLYRSKDLFEWEFVNIMAKATGNFGFMWECPDLFSLEGKDVLVMSPQGLKPEGDLYHNLHQAGYVIGNLNYETGDFSHGSFHLLDYGFDFYAPQTTIDSKGRRILIAWMAMWESIMPEQDHHWAGAMTIPRELKYKDGKIISQPVPEIQSLREEKLISFENVKVTNEQKLQGISGDCIELQLLIDAKQASSFGFKLRVNKETNEETLFTYDVKNSIFSFDRTRSGQGPKGIRKAPVVLSESKLSLRIFIDKSSVEVFINGGEQVMTGRIYPSEKAADIVFFSNGEIELTEVKKWDLKRAIKPL